MLFSEQLPNHISARLECDRCSLRVRSNSDQSKDYKFHICCVFPMYTAFSSMNNDRMADSKANLSVLSDMFIYGLLLVLYLHKVMLCA